MDLRHSLQLFLAALFFLAALYLWHLRKLRKPSAPTAGTWSTNGFYGSANEAIVDAYYREANPIRNLDHFVTIIYDPPKDGYGGSVHLENFSPGLVDLRAYPQLAGHVDGSACSEACRQELRR